MSEEIEEKTEKCEVCDKCDVQWISADACDETTYKVCSNCVIPLINCSLSKEQFFNLIKNGHNDKEFLLHSDYYINGIALQPVGNEPKSKEEFIERIFKAKEGIDYRDEDKEEQQDYDAGFDAGIDVYWDWLRTALLKMMGKKELQDTKFIPKLQKTIEDLTPEEVEEFLKIE